LPLQSEQTATRNGVHLRSGKIVESLSCHANQMAADEWSALSRTILRMLDRAFPFENGPASETVLRNLHVEGLDARVIDIDKRQGIELLQHEVAGSVVGTLPGS